MTHAPDAPDPQALAEACAAAMWARDEASANLGMATDDHP
jgi:hypothetical protein